MTRDGRWLLGPSPTGAYILLRLRHARHCRPGAAAPPTAFAARHPSRGIPVSLSSPSSTRTQEGCKVTGETPRSPRTLARSLTLSSPFLPYRVLRSRPPSRPTPPSTTTLSHPRESTRKTTATPPLRARLPPAPFLRSHGHHFRWKVLRGRWGARADVARGGGATTVKLSLSFFSLSFSLFLSLRLSLLPFLPLLLLLRFFFLLSPLLFVLLRAEDDSCAQSIR